MGLDTFLANVWVLRADTTISGHDNISVITGRGADHYAWSVISRPPDCADTDDGSVATYPNIPKMVRYKAIFVC